MSAARLLSATLVLAAALGAARPRPAAAGDAARPAPAPATAPAPAADDAPGTAWRAARWGMSPQQVVTAFPGEAYLVQPEVRLPDGNTVSAGIDGLAWEGLTVNVRFVFEGGKLALVSLRTPQNQYVEAATYDRLRKALSERWGDPLESTADSQFIDLRQTRWDRGGIRSDLKYIPGVVAVVHYPRPGAAAPPAGSPAVKP
jgi:hypothetical protein